MRRQQSGVALAITLIILLVVTIVGISAIGTTAFEHVMATNIQENNRAFQGAESGLSKGLTTAKAFDVYNDTSHDFTFGDATATVVTEFVGWAPPKRGSGYSAINYESANFDQGSTATTPGHGRAVLHQGASHIVNKDAYASR